MAVSAYHRSGQCNSEVHNVVEPELVEVRPANAEVRPANATGFHPNTLSTCPKCWTAALNAVQAPASLDPDAEPQNL